MAIMGKNSFFLTDLMKTGDHQLIEKFLNLSTLPGHNISHSGEYYTLHDMKLKNYDRKFALIDHRLDNVRLWENKYYWQELKNRINNLNKDGFKFIIAQQWESEANLEKHQYYREFLKDMQYHTWSGGSSWFWFLMYHKHRDKKYNFNHTNKKYDFLYLNKQSRSHRKKLFDALMKERLLDNSLYSFLDVPYKIKLQSSYELPWVDTRNYPRYGSDQDIYEPQFNDTAINIISETNDNNNDIFITEKLWKPIIAKQVFVVHGNPRYLKKLREMGFKTFDSIFDESYDSEINPNKRIEKLTRLCYHLRTMDKEKIYLESESIRQHNHERFFDITALSNCVDETVLGFLKFADRG